MNLEAQGRGAIDLVCYLTDGREVDVRPARNRRDWMNHTPHSYAYRCLPLSIANAHGWEVRAPMTCEAEWNGGSDKKDIQIDFVEDRLRSAGTTPFAESHFGSGVLTFNVMIIVETPPGYDLWVMGPANEFKDGIQAMAAVIETYWMPFTFTMNWKFTRPGLKVRFEKGEPFCVFFPIEHRLLERVHPRFENLRENPELERQFELGYYKRALPIAYRRLKGKESKLRERDRFQDWYMKGEMPDGTGVFDHTKRLELKPFETADGRCER